MLEKELYIEIDRPNYSPIYSVQYDYNSRFYNITILNNSQPLDLTDLRVIVAGKKPDGETIFNTCKVLDAKKGRVQLELTEQMNSVTGVSEYALELFSNDGMLSSQPFELRITKSTISKSVASSSELSALQNALNEVQDIDNRFAQTNAQLSDVNRKLLGYNNVKSYKCDDGEYVKGDGVHDDTTGIQRALDNAVGKLFFPPGTYKVTGNGEYILKLTRNVDIEFQSNRNTVIRADNVDDNTSVLLVSIENNYGLLDVRNFNLKNINIFFNGGGLHALVFKGGLPLLTCNIENVNLSKGSNSDGYGLYIYDSLCHSKIHKSTFDCVYAKVYDANLFEKNLFTGHKTGLTLDCGEGIYNNTVNSNTFACRDGAVTIIKGDAIRITNNQIEQYQAYGQNKHPKRCMIHIEGNGRRCHNIIIRENNLGGGTNLDYLIYVENAKRCVISQNQLIPTNIAEVYFGSASKYCIFKNDNNCRDQISNPRPNTFMKANVIDYGTGNFGTSQNPSAYYNGWTGGKSFYKDESGLVIFTSPLSAGSTLASSRVIDLPFGFRPKDFSFLTCVTSGGVGHLKYISNGRVDVGNLPSNSDVIINPFFTGEQDD